MKKLLFLFICISNAGLQGMKSGQPDPTYGPLPIIANPQAHSNDPIDRYKELIEELPSKNRKIITYTFLNNTPKSLNLAVWAHTGQNQKLRPVWEGPVIKQQQIRAKHAYYNHGTVILKIYDHSRNLLREQFITPSHEGVIYITGTNRHNMMAHEIPE